MDSSGDIFFVVDPILSIYPVTWWDFWVMSVCIVAMIIVYRSSKKSSPVPGVGQKLTSFPLPDISDIAFETKIAQILRVIIGYPGALPDAHTAKEIAEYSGHTLLPLLRDLETHEYRGQSLTLEEKKSLLSTITAYKIPSF